MRKFVNTAACAAIAAAAVCSSAISAHADVAVGTVAANTSDGPSAVLLEAPQVQTQAWQGFAGEIDAQWSYGTTVMASRRIRTPSGPVWQQPQPFVSQFTGFVTNPNNYGSGLIMVADTRYTGDFSISLSSNYVYTPGDFDWLFYPGTYVQAQPSYSKHKAPAYTFVELEAREAIENLYTDFGTSATSKTVLRKNGRKFVSKRSDSGGAELALGSQVVTRRGGLLGLADAYAAVDHEVQDNAFDVQGRTMVSNVWRKRWDKKLTTRASSSATFTTTYRVNRLVDFDLSATLARFKDVDLSLSIVDARTNEVIYAMTRPAGSSQDTIDLTGQLGASDYRFTLTADTKILRSRGKFRRRGGAGEFQMSFNATPVVSAEELLAQATSGEMPLDEMIDLFGLSEVELTNIVADGRLPADYLRELTGLDDLGLIEQVLSGEKTWALIDVLADFAVHDGNGHLLFDSINGLAIDPNVSAYRHWLVDADDNVLAPYIIKVGDLTMFDLAITLLGDENPAMATAALVPEPASLGLLLLGSLALLTRNSKNVTVDLLRGGR